MEVTINLQYVYNSLIFSGIGIIMLIIAFVVADLITPRCSIWKEIVEKQNIAVAILLGSFLVGVAMIIAAAVHG